MSGMGLPESHLAQEAIAALVDGELASGPAARAARHLTGCVSCRMAVQAQREAKEALHGATDVAVPGDLLSRLRAIPFTTDVPGAGGPGALSIGPGQLTLRDDSGSWSVPLDPYPAPAVRPGQARWLRRSMAGALAGLGIGVTALALSLPAPAERVDPPGSPVAGSHAGERSEVVPPVVRTLTDGSQTALARAGAAGGAP
ncbi:anti-sigma factor family protein [Trujillonella endophytica]|uniref:Putative zinc-finger n=1 Tax=Trujillonella endophytica TaxID=673521 RepID=A0A1H8SB77_9ACTN|nr:zf-HC2 domain-containing protein [Trujillella endophytica]SEO75980.1 Putative zinc-finger [Trujillella endophytica]